MLGVHCARTATALRLGVAHLVGDGDEQAAVGDAVGVGADGGGDVGSDLDILAGLGGEREVDGGVGESALAVGGVEVLDQGGEGVELRGGGVPGSMSNIAPWEIRKLLLPSDKNLAGVRLEVESKHGLVVLHVDLNLLLRLVVSNTKAIPDLNLGTVIASDSEKSSDHALLLHVSSEGVVEDGEQSLRVDDDIEGLGGRLLRGHRDVGERAGEMDVGIGGHDVWWGM